MADRVAEGIRSARRYADHALGEGRRDGGNAVPLNNEGSGTIVNTARSRARAGRA